MAFYNYNSSCVNCPFLVECNRVERGLSYDCVCIHGHVSTSVALDFRETLFVCAKAVAMTHTGVVKAYCKAQYITLL